MYPINSKRLRLIIIAALLIAIDIISARLLYVYTPGNIDRISPQFIPNALSGAILGPLWASLICGVADVLGMFTNSAGLVFNPFFTMSAITRGLLYGIILYRKRPSFVRMFAAVAVVTVVVDLGMNPIWLSLMYGQPWFPTLLAKLPVRLITIPIYASVAFAAWKGLQRAKITL